MSADNGIYIILSEGVYKVQYFQGDQPSGVSDVGKFKTLEEAVKKAKELDEKYGGVEYGIRFYDPKRTQKIS
jgi:hypothetical protein